MLFWASRNEGSSKQVLYFINFLFISVLNDDLCSKSANFGPKSPQNRKLPSPYYYVTESTKTYTELHGIILRRAVLLVAVLRFKGNGTKS